MNTIYKLVWSAATGKYVVASELAKGRKKKSCRNALVTALAVALAASAPFGAAFAADAATTADTCTTSEGQPGTLNTVGICTANNTASTMGVSNITPFDAELPTSPGIAIVTTGNTATTTNINDIAVGNGSTGSSSIDAYPATAVGFEANASGLNTTALGSNTNATADAATALGSGSIASGYGATALIGTASGTQAFAIGGTASGDYAQTFGTGAAASTDYSIAIGTGAGVSAGGVTGATGSIALGYGATAAGIDSIVIGTDATHSGSYATVVGGNASALGGGGATALGSGATANGSGSVALGINSVADATRANAVSVGNDGTTGTAFTRQIVNMGAGTQANDAVNVSQLTPVVTALGGGASINATTGAVTGPTYTLANGGTQTTVGDALSALDSSLTTTNTNVTALDGRVTTNEGSISTLQQQIGDGTVGLVQQNGATSNITVASATGGSMVDFTGTSGARVLTGLANGTNNTDAVTIAQLKAVGVVDPDGEMLGALHYDDLTLATATLGGTNGTTINNLAPGLIASGSMQAVNGGQLFDMQQNFQNQFNLLNGQYASLDGRVTTIEQGIADGDIGGPVPSPGTGSDSTQVGDGANASGPNSTAVGNDAVASGDNSTATGAGSQATGSNSTANGANAVASGNGSTAVGEGASATGTNSTALGSNSNATGNNSVALGAGSVADRDNTVSVGSPGNERQITNVAAGTQRTDAANWGQVQDAVNGVQDWANQKFSQQDTRINRIGAMGAAYGQMAFSAQGIQTPNKVGVGVGTQGGQAAIAVGYSRQIKSNLNVSFGGSASGSEVSVGAGMSLGW